MGKVLLTIAFALSATPTFADDLYGKIGKTFFDCAGASKLWNIHWFGVTGHSEDDIGPDQKALQKAPTNQGTWTDAVEPIGISGQLSPAENLRWYRAIHWYKLVDEADHNQSGSHHFFDTVHYTTMCWVPQHSCSGDEEPR